MLLACMDTWLDGHIEALVQGQERHDRTQRDAAHAGDGHGGTHQSTDSVADIAQLSVDGHHDVGEAVGLLGAVLELVVQLAEALEGLLLVGEDLDDLLAFHHLFDIAVHFAEVALLCDEVLAALLGDLLGAEEHQGYHQHGDDGELPAQHAHAGKDGNDGDGAGHQLQDALAEHLAEGIHVVGVDGHDVAVRMGVKVADGQALHVGEELDTQVAQVPCVTLTMMRALSHAARCPPHRCSPPASVHRPAAQSWVPAAGSWG